MADTVNFGRRTVTTEEYFAPGHRACVGCAEALAVRLACKALGQNVIVAMATGCMEIVSSPLPWTSWRVPWIHTLFENTAAVASGIEAGLQARERKDTGSGKKTRVVAMGGDGGTADIGLQALSGALERGHDFLYICYDNEAYMNTGIQ
ncbi:MAG: pyruvate ferredoxin oxidoreductase, partial [Chloroflexi bacterium]|nr:pyruvate ferredoxin oxidoreductase [Chloroflexota bacterium]